MKKKEQYITLALILVLMVAIFILGYNVGKGWQESMQ